MCVEIDVIIVPFEMKYDLYNPNNFAREPVISALGTSEVRAPWTGAYEIGTQYIQQNLEGKNFGYLYQSSDKKADLVGSTDSKLVEGALMVRHTTNDRYMGVPGSVGYYLSVNYPSAVYVCRNIDDNEVMIPTWLNNGDWNHINSTSVRIKVQNEDEVLECFFQMSAGTKRNKYDGVVSGAIPIGTNTVEDKIGVNFATDYLSMFVVIAVPIAPVPKVIDITITYEWFGFVACFFSYGLMVIYFLALAANLLHKVNYRLDRVMSYLINKSFTGEEKHVIAALFLTNGETPCNIEFRSRIFHGSNVIYLFLLTPFLLIISWGSNYSVLYQPTSLGIGISWLGMSAIFFWYGYQLWRVQMWRMDTTIVVSMTLGVLFCLVFIIAVIFNDPLVSNYGQPINFPSISLLFGTINCIPLLFLVFKQDKMYKNDLKRVIDKMSYTVYDIAESEGKVTKKKKTMGANKSFHALLGSSYTINPNVPSLKMASVIQDNVKKEMPDDRSEMLLYRTSLAFLFVYWIIAAVATAYPAIAFLNCLALTLLDLLHTALSKGDTNWTPAYKIFLLVTGRLLIMSCSGGTWLLNYCLAYMLYSIAFVDEMINIILPHMTKAQAAEIAFTGKETTAFNHSQDAAGTPYFTFFLLTFCFIAIVLISLFGDYSSLPMDTVSVFGATWGVSVFGIISVLAIVTGGLAMATVRAFYLKGNGLLKGYARTGYFLRKEWDIPLILALLTEVAIVSSSVIIYAATNATAVLVAGIFMPPIFGCLAYSYSVWVVNDYELVHWPPADEEDVQEGENPSDLDVAFNMIEGLFGPEDGPETNDDDEMEQGESRTLKGFELPKLEVIGEKQDGPIKMPALPLKSVLRKKREKMGIKLKTAPIIKDVRGRDGADDDKFGTGDIIDPNDPWAQFENEADSDDEKPLVEKKVLKYKIVRRGIFEHPALLKFIDNAKSNPVGKIVIGWWTKCMKSLNNRSKAYSKVDPDEEDSEDDDELEGEGEAKTGETQLQSISKMPFWSAAVGGFLTKAEYTVLGSWFMGLFLIFIMGVTLADTVSPTWLGHVIWVAIVLFITTSVPIYQYFHTYIIDETTYLFIGFNTLLHFLFCLLFFVVGLDADNGLPASLWIMDFFFYFPALVYIVIELLFWIDGNFVIEKIDKDGDGNVTSMEYLMYFRAYPMLIAMAIILDWQFFFWIGELVGTLGVLLLLVLFFSYFFVRDWATNDFYVSPEMRKIGDLIIKLTLFITSLVALFSPQNPIFPLSVVFFILMARMSTGLILKLMLAEPESITYVSPFILPVYSYNPKTNDVVDESEMVKSFLFLMMTGFVWGFMFSMFYYPVSLGVTITCFFLLFFSALLAASVAHIPLTLGQLCNLTTTESIQDSAKIAVEKFQERKTPLNLEMPDWQGEADESQQVKHMTHVETLKRKTIIEICMDVMSETRALTYIKDDEVKEEAIVEAGDVDEVIPTTFEKIKKYVSEQLKKAFELIPMGQLKGYKRHSESLFDFTDAVAEAIVIGKGPLGFIGLDGQLYKLFQEAQTNPRLKFLQQPWLNAYDEAGNRKSNVLLFEKLDHNLTVNNLDDCDHAINHCFHEETRCAVHFLCMVIVAANAKLQRETVLFQKFLRENRFRLASNDITPPPEIFSSASFTSIDIPLVAVWLSTLTGEERERFNMLKASFSDEQKEKDYAMDNEDYAMTLDALNLIQDRSLREIDMCAKTKRNAEIEGLRRVQNFAETLTGAEKAKFDSKMKVWTENADVYVDSKDQELYDKFQEACHGSADAVTDYARYTLGQLELAMQDCRLGEYGRNYQFVDPEFTPGDFALGNSPASQSVLGWRCAPGISENVELFEGGADPDDVENGVYNNVWLLSAICMLAAGGGFGSDVVTDALQNVFIGKVTPEGSISYSTEVGAYGLRLFKQGIWNPVILDDLFPMLQHNLWTNENKGIAVAHSKECNELWVSLIEKAFAKFYGSYSELERGYVHHALQDLTGCETECVCLSHASRGVGKRTLWQKLLRFKSNEYILGAGTGTAALADKEILEMGIVFESAYTIYDVQYIDGLQLLQLRNPPGDHEEWKGDWSDKSSLWNRRLKSKLGWADVDDNTFWISFDDFCNVFRYLYVCKYYGKKWKALTLPGIWKKSNELEQENKDDIKNIIMQSDPSLGGTIDAVEEKKKKAKSRVDTSGGIPTKHNAACILENNPHYSLQIHRPTDFRITVSQTDSRGTASGEIVPCSVYIVRNEHPTTPMRLKSLDRDNVVFYSGEPRRERVQHLYGSLNPGLYIVLIAPYVSGLEGNFTCTLLSNYRASFSSIWPPAWMIRKTKTKAEKEKEKAGKGMEAQLDEAANKGRRFIRDLFGSSAADDGDSDSEEDE